MDTLKGIAFFVGVIAYGAWLFRRNRIEAEVRRNELHDAPSDQQLRWHVRHLREDISALVLINYTLLVIVAAHFVFKD